MNTCFKALALLAFGLSSLLGKAQTASTAESLPDTIGCSILSTLPKATVQVGWGYQRVQHQDLIFSPLVHRDGSIANGQVAVAWGYRKRHLHEVGLSTSLFNPGSITPYTFLLQGEEATAWDHSFTFVNLHYHVQAQSLTDGKTSLRPGVKWDNAIWAKGYSYGRSGSFGYFASFGLKGTLSADRLFSKWLHPHARLELPLLSWVARSPYLANDDEFIENISSNKGVNTFFSYVGDGSLQSWNRLQSVDLTLGNSIRVGKHKAGLEYHLLLLHHSRPLNLVHLQQGITGTFTFSL